MATFNDARVKEMLLGRRAVRAVAFPGLEGVQIGVRILTDDELDGARLRAAAYCKSRNADLNADPEMLDREIQRQVVWRAFIDPDDTSDDPRPFFPSDRDVRSLDSVTVEALFSLYAEHQEWVSPIRTLSEEQVSELVEALGKGLMPEQALTAMSHATLRHCIRSMASRLVS